jgi:hypothetical protein
VREAGGEYVAPAEPSAVESRAEAAAETARVWRDSLNKLPGQPHTAEPGFDPQAALESSEGAFIEVGGPTSKGYAMIDVEPLQDRFAASNRRPYAYSDPLPQDRPADFRADLRQLPLEDKSVAGIFASAITERTPSPDGEPSDNYNSLAAEAYRVTRDGGYLVWQHAAPRALDAALEHGWRPVAGLSRPGHKNNGHDFTYDVIYQKGTT